MVVELFLTDIRQITETDSLKQSSPLLALSRDPKRIMQFHKREDRARCIVGELLSRKILGDSVLSHINDGNMRIKPVSPDSDMHNLSHDNDFVVLATCETHSVGVDVMKIQPTSPSMSVERMLLNLRSIFSLREWEFIQEASKDYEKLKRFYQLWTAKESYVKCLGTGLYTEPQDLTMTGFDARPAGGQMELKVSQRGAESVSEQFRIHVFSDVIDGYIVAVCVGPVAMCNPSWTKYIDKLARSTEEFPSDIILTKAELVSVAELVSRFTESS